MVKQNGASPVIERVRERVCVCVAQILSLTNEQPLVIIPCEMRIHWTMLGNYKHIQQFNFIFTLCVV
jgi:hypothetical protein